MALKGQGDPRWIVEARDDGRNVNNWHWTETDFTSWCKNRLSELLEKMELETSTATIKTTTLTCTGEVSVNTRKQKTIFFYELDVNLKWEGKIKSTGDDIKGNIQMPYISEENDDDDFEVRVTVEEENKERSNAKDELRSKIIPILKEKIPQMLQELRETGTNKALLPSTKTQTNTSTTVPAAAPAKEVLNTPVEAKVSPVTAPTTTTTPTDSKKSSSKTTVKTTSFTLKEKFVCGVDDLFACLVDPGRIKAYAGGDAEFSPEVGGKFRMFNGYVSGENIEITRPTKLVQKWRFNSWPEDHYSTVTIQLEQKDSKVLLTLTQTGVPEGDKDHTEKGWSSNFWVRIKGIFGFGSGL